MLVLEISIPWRREKLHVLNMYLTHNITFVKGKDKLEDKY
jgi:hypothetical protein